MSDSSEDHSPTEPVPSYVPAGEIRIGCCPQCEYDLKGLAFQGQCPECGTPYTADTLLAPNSLPSAVSLCFRYGWPVAFVMLVGAPALFGGGRDESMFCCATVGLLMIPVNGAIQAMILKQHPVMSRTHLRAVSPRVRRLSHFATVLLLLTVVLPLIIFGGCVLIVLVLL